MRFKARARTQPRPGVMNKLEARYATQLEARKRAGEIVWWAYEAITLKLAPHTRYTPDFAVITSDGAVEFHECKGFWRDDARVKIKVAAALFPWADFIAIDSKGKVERFEP